MVQFFDRFDEIWATAGLVVNPTPPQANSGFLFLGTAPPTVELFNAVFQWNDEKDNWLFNQIGNVIRSDGITEPLENDLDQLLNAINRIVTGATGGFIARAGDTMTGPLRFAAAVQGIGYGQGAGGLVAFETGRTAGTIDLYINNALQGPVAMRDWTTANHVLKIGDIMSGQLQVDGGIRTVILYAGNSHTMQVFSNENNHRFFAFNGPENSWAFFPDTSEYSLLLGNTPVIRMDGGRNFYCVNSIFANGSVNAGTAIIASTINTGNGNFTVSANGSITSNNSVTAQGGFTTQPGAAGAIVVTLPDAAANAFKPGGGEWNTISDGRYKTVLGSYDQGLDVVIKLNPVRYTTKRTDLFAVATSTEYIGLIGQEAEGPMPELIGYRKGTIEDEEVDDMRVLNTTALKFAFINAFKEVHERLTALEGAK